MTAQEQKFVQLQHQIKQNNVELQDYLHDLDSWESEIKDKEKQLKETKSEEGQILPPVRNSLEKKRKKKKKKIPKESETTTKEKKRINAYDFRAWDKFDVEAECEKVDAESASPEEYETDEEWEVQRMELLANQHKEQGNEMFKVGDYIEAVECYTRGIECHSESAILPANRAMALLKLERYAAAELDCTRSLALDPGYVKALHRRGQARAALKKYSEAKDDFTEVLKKEPKNRPAKAELEKVERLLNPPKLLQSKNLDASDAGIVKAVYKPPDQRSKKPLQRIKIEELGEDEEVEKRREQILSAQAKQSEAKKIITARDNELFDKLTQDDSETKDISRGKSDQHREILVQEMTVTEEDTSQISGITATSNKKSRDAESALKNVPGVVKSKKDGSKTAENTASSSPTVSPRIPPVPTSSYEFQADWKVLKDTTEQFYQYFKEVDPSIFPKLFGQFLDADVLIKIFATLKEFYIINNMQIYPVLLHLCRVKRFSMTIMFMSSSDKAVLQELFVNVGQQEEIGKEELSKLKVTYGL